MDVLEKADWDVLSSYAGLLSLAVFSIYAGAHSSLPVGINEYMWIRKLIICFCHWCVFSMPGPREVGKWMRRMRMVRNGCLPKMPGFSQL